MAKKILFIIDPIESLKHYKDSSVALMSAFQKQGASVFITKIQDIFLKNGLVYANAQKVFLTDSEQAEEDWYVLESGQKTAETYGLATFNQNFVTFILADFDVVFLRKDPPFDLNYLYTTHLLSYAVSQGANVLNHPDAVRDFPEKLSIYGFSQYTVPSLVCANMALIKSFLDEHKDVIVKPLDGMGGSGVFRIQREGMNVGAILETLTEHGQTPIMVQRYIPEITQGDKRILMINGEPMPYVLARMPAQGETRANLAAGGTGVAQPISDKARKIAQEVGSVLAPKGLFIIGLDMIGDYITEINVTSPTCFVEIEQQTGFSVAQYCVDTLMDRA
ncbi:MAG: glutathione synthase [Alcaligenaceae bacterium]|nr:glutathione synthase [Alcaligenaceae bacterium]